MQANVELSVQLHQGRLHHVVYHAELARSIPEVDVPSVRCRALPRKAPHQLVSLPSVGHRCFLILRLRNYQESILDIDDLDSVVLGAAGRQAQ